MKRKLVLEGIGGGVEVDELRELYGDLARVVDNHSEDWGVEWGSVRVKGEQTKVKMKEAQGKG